MLALTSGSNNIAIGYNSGNTNLVGKENILIGKEAGLNLNESNQIFIGTQAGSSASNGINNIFIGYLSGAGIDTQSNNVVLGYSALSSGQCNNSVMIGTFAGSINNGNENVFIIGVRINRGLAKSDKSINKSNPLNCTPAFCI